MKNKFYFSKQFGLFIGQLKENRLHKHYALQLSLTNTGELRLWDEQNKAHRNKAFYVNYNVEHQLICKNRQMTILVNPLSLLGYQLHVQLSGKTISKIPEILQIQLSISLKKYENDEFSFEEFCKNIEEVLSSYSASCDIENDFLDERITRVIKHMEDNSEKLYSLAEAAQFCFLSPSRFRHLFKEKTKLNFRRYQLWNRLIKSLPLLGQYSVTETAHQSGFTDSSHYTRTFVETFGVTPKFLMPK